MVRAILDGRKTQTRRVITPQPEWGVYQITVCPYGEPGDTLWVREDMYLHGANQNHYYSADKQGVGNVIHERLMQETASGRSKASTRTIPSIFMPKWACRLRLTVTDIRVERLQGISWLDAVAEGVSPSVESIGNPVSESAARADIAAFAELWDSINIKKHPWESNPWVWVISWEQS